MYKKLIVVFFSLMIFGFSSVIGVQINDSPNGDHSSLKFEFSVQSLQRTDSAFVSPDNSVKLGESSYDQDVIVYTAHQDWLSRIYILRMDGSVITYFEYSFYFFADLEVVDNEAYVAEAFAPRSYKLDLNTGDLDLIIDDWSLYYFYDLAFDGTYFYVTEWDLNRYDINGVKDGMVSFDENVNGGAWDGTYYWTLTDENLIKCWDVSSWPTLTEIPGNAFAPPSSNCRGLWFDGRYFWTAESVDGMLGYIYKFNSNGQVISQWLEPAFRGWSACVIKGNYPPLIPETPYGPNLGEVEIEYNFSSNTIDPEGDNISYLFDWDDGTDSGWLGPYISGANCNAFHTWMNPGLYYVKVKAKDINDHESDWSDPLNLAIYTCGDCNSDGVIDVGDVVYLINYLFKGGDEPVPMLCVGDCNSDTIVNVGDVVHLINYLFKGGPEPEGCCE